MSWYHVEMVKYVTVIYLWHTFHDAITCSLCRKALYCLTMLTLIFKGFAGDKTLPLAIRSNVEKFLPWRDEFYLISHLFHWSTHTCSVYLKASLPSVSKEATNGLLLNTYELIVIEKWEFFPVRFSYIDVWNISLWLLY